MQTRKRIKRFRTEEQSDNRRHQALKKLKQNYDERDNDMYYYCDWCDKSWDKSRGNKSSILRGHYNNSKNRCKVYQQNRTENSGKQNFENGIVDNNLYASWQDVEFDSQQEDFDLCIRNEFITNLNKNNEVVMDNTAAVLEISEEVAAFTNEITDLSYNHDAQFYDALTFTETMLNNIETILHDEREDIDDNRMDHSIFAREDRLMFGDNNMIATDAPSSDMKDFQLKFQRLLKVTREKAEFKFNSTAIGKPDWLDLVDIYEHMLHYNTGRLGGDATIVLLRRMFARHGLNIALPTSHLTLQRIFDKFAGKLTTIHTFRIKLPVEFFGTTDPTDSDSPLLETIGHCFDIVEVVGKALLLSRVDQFALSSKVVMKPTEETKTHEHPEMEREYSDFSTGSLFEKFQLFYKPKDELNGFPNVAVGLGLTMDDALINKGKQSMKPICIYIYNQIGKQ